MVTYQPTPQGNSAGPTFDDPIDTGLGVPTTTQPTSSSQGGYQPLISVDPGMAVPRASASEEGVGSGIGGVVDLPNAVVVVTQPVSTSVGSNEMGGKRSVDAINADNSDYKGLTSSIVTGPSDVPAEPDKNPIVSL